MYRVEICNTNYKIIQVDHNFLSEISLALKQDGYPNLKNMIVI